MNAMNGTPVDLAAVQADDALLTALIPPVVVTNDALSRALYAWGRDVDAEPVGELVDTDTALAAISAARSPRPLPLHARTAAAVRGFFRLLGGNR